MNAMDMWRTMQRAMTKALCTVAFTFTPIIQANAQSSWVDFTENLIVNPEFDSSTEGWTCDVYNVSNLGFQGASYWNGDAFLDHFVEAWRNGATLGGGKIYQNVYLASGKYRLEADAISVNQNGGWWFSSDVTNVYLYAQPEGKTAFKTVLNTENNAPEHFALEFTLTAGANVDLGVLMDDGCEANWVAFDNVRLSWYGKKVSVKSINLDKTSLSLGFDEEYKLTATVTPSNATLKNVKWVSDNPMVATVDRDGNVKAVGEGVAVITASIDDGTYHEVGCVVEVTMPEVNPEAIVINEIMASNVDMFVDPSFNYGSWIEIYNPTSSAANLGGLYITDDPANLKKFRLAYIAGVVPAKGFKNIWFDHFGIWSRGELTQVDFKLNYDGGTIIISDGESIIAQQDYPKAIGRTSYARKQNGGEEWGVSAAPTPEATNASMAFATEQLAVPEVDTDGQVFESSLSVKVKYPTGTTLRYTTDGTTPTLTNGSTSNNGTFSVTNTRVYRFRLFKNGYLPSEVVTRSYIKKDRSIDLPVISVVTDDKNLNSSELGVFQRGPNGRPGNGQNDKCNWNMDWDRPVNFEYILPAGKSVLNQEVDLSICGGWSRANSPHSFKLKAAKYYNGNNSLDFQFFEGKPYLKHKAIQLRNGGSGNRMKDAGLQEIMRQSGLNVNTQSVQPVLVYINGKYYTTSNMREPNNKHYGSANYGIDTDEMDQFEMSPDSGYVQMSGTKDAFDELISLSYNATDDAAYAEIAKLLDIDEFANYIAAEMYLGNWDWPQNNAKGFRDRNDGKFHFVIYDLDGAWSSDIRGFGSKQWYTFDSLRGEDALGNSLWNQRKSEEIELVTLFLNMLENDDFKRKFIDAITVMGGSTFDPAFARTVVDDLNATLKLGGQDLSWDANDIVNKLTGRQQSVAQQLQYSYNLGVSSSDMFKLGVSGNAEGSQIMINHMVVPRSQFSGYLYSPITLKAMAPAGYVFKGWQLKSGSLSSDAEQVSVFDKGSRWTYDDTDTPLDDTSWQEDSFSKSGKAPLGYDTNNSKTFNTKIAERLQTYYFTKTFTVDEEISADDQFVLDYTVDDAMVVYVNGVEAGRYNLPSGEISFYTNGGWAQSNPDNGTMELPAGLFKLGENTIAVEVHNYFNPSSSDIYWDASLTHVCYGNASSDGNFVSTNPTYHLPGGSNIELKAVFEPVTDKDELIELAVTPVKVNEVSAGNDVYVNDHFKKDDWFELYNTTDKPIDVAGMYLSDSEAKPQKFQIPANDELNTIIEPHGHLVVWASKRDMIGEQIHTSFKLANDDVTEGQAVILTSEDGTWMDKLAYPKHGAKETVGLYPDGTNKVYAMPLPTIGKSNTLNSESEFLYTYIYEEPNPNLQPSWKFTLDLAEGWNWVSHPLERNIAISEVNASALSILGQNASAKKEAAGWTGDLKALSPTSAYKIQMNESATYTFNENNLFAEGNTIALAKGWNWVGYPVVETKSISQALSKFTPSEGDIFLGKEGFATYENGAWNGSLEILEPGDGYMYKSAAPASLKYDNALPQSAANAKSRFRIQPRTPWSANAYAFPNVMGLVAQVDAKDQPVDVANLSVGAFTEDGECRGVGKYIDGKLFMTMHGNGGENIIFKAADATTGVVYEVNETYAFESDVKGSRKMPVTLTIGVPVDIASVRHSSVLDTVGYYNLGGTLVSDSKANLSKGVYVVKYRLTDGSTIAKKLLVK